MRFFALALAGSCMIAGHALAFGTINALGQNAEHEKITRAALATLGAKTLDELAGKKGTFGAIGAPDKPGRGLISSPDAHCDNGDYLDAKNYPQTAEKARAALEACRAWMMASLEKAVSEARTLSAPDASNMALDCEFDGKTGSAKCKVLDALGVALHASQDFYSHSNWTDKTTGAIKAENPPGLAHEGRSPWIDPRATTGFPQGLISGCFGSKPEKLYCNYGGAGPVGSKKRVKHDFLNKDAGPIGASGATGHGTSSRGKVNGNFERAVAAAIDDTQDKWAWFEEQVVARYGAADGAKIICAMRNDDAAACSP